MNSPLGEWHLFWQNMSLLYYETCLGEFGPISWKLLSQLKNGLSLKLSIDRCPLISIDVWFQSLQLYWYIYIKKKEICLIKISVIREIKYSISSWCSVVWHKYLLSVSSENNLRGFCIYLSIERNSFMVVQFYGIFSVYDNFFSLQNLTGFQLLLCSDETIIKYVICCLICWHFTTIYDHWWHCCGAPVSVIN